MIGFLPFFSFFAGIGGSRKACVISGLRSSAESAEVGLGKFSSRFFFPLAGFSFTMRGNSTSKVALIPDIF